MGERLGDPERARFQLIHRSEIREPERMGLLLDDRDEHRLSLFQKAVDDHHRLDLRILRHIGKDRVIGFQEFLQPAGDIVSLLPPVP